MYNIVILQYLCTKEEPSEHEMIATVTIAWLTKVNCPKCSILPVISLVGYEDSVITYPYWRNSDFEAIGVSNTIFICRVLVTDKLHV